MGKYVGIGVLVLLIIFGFYYYGKHNTFVVMEEDINGQWAQVENEYQRRFDLIENLVNTVKGYADFEKSTLVEVTEARAKAMTAMSNSNNGTNLGEFNQANGNLVGAMRGMLGYVEKYPELKANENFMDLQRQLEGTENRVTTERMRFNEEVEKFNKEVKTIPNNIIASIGGFEPRDYFESTEGSENTPKVDFSK